MPTVTANGVDLCYEMQGRGDPVVLIAGYSVDHQVWATLIPPLAERYQVIAIDNRGSGGSGCPEGPYTVEMMADDAAGILQATVGRPAHFIGHSLGGCIVQAVARRHPAVVRSAIIASSFVKASPRLAQYARLRVEMARAVTPDALVARFMALVGFSNDFLARPGVVEQIIRAAQQPVIWGAPESQLHALLAFDSREWLQDIRCPALLIGADDDVLVDVSDIGLMASKIVDSKTHVFENVGHVPMVENAQAFEELVQRFLGEQDGRT